MSSLSAPRFGALMLTLGLVAGFSAHALLADRPEWFARPTVVKKVAPPRVVDPSVPIRYPAEEKVLARLQKQFAEAVVVVVADESVDQQRNVVNRTVVEVWKGPPALAGKPMNSKIGWKRPYVNAPATRRVLVFLPLTTFVDSGSYYAIHDDRLGVNPALRIDDVRRALTGEQPVAAR